MFNNKNNMFTHTGMIKGAGQTAQKNKGSNGVSRAVIGQFLPSQAAQGASIQEQHVSHGPGEQYASKLPEPSTSQNQSVTAPSAPSPVVNTVLGTNNPWSKGQVVGGAREGKADFKRLGGGFGNADTDSMKHTFGRIAQN